MFLSLAFDSVLSRELKDVFIGSLAQSIQDEMFTCHCCGQRKLKRVVFVRAVEGNALAQGALRRLTQ